MRGTGLLARESSAAAAVSTGAGVVPATSTVTDCVSGEFAAEAEDAQDVRRRDARRHHAAVARGHDADARVERDAVCVYSGPRQRDGLSRLDRAGARGEAVNVRRRPDREAVARQRALRGRLLGRRLLRRRAGCQRCRERHRKHDPNFCGNIHVSPAQGIILAHPMPLSAGTQRNFTGRPRADIAPLRRPTARLRTNLEFLSETQLMIERMPAS